MQFTHICPTCKKKHELETTPEPSQPCQDCKNFDKFMGLIRNQFEYGGKKYALNDERESTDILFEVHGKNWLFGTIDKYTFRFKNLSRERDLLKIACYQYITWLKRGFFVIKAGVNDPPLDTNIQQKQQHFNTFIERAREYRILRLTSPFYMFYNEENINDLIEGISKELQGFSKSEWKEITEINLFWIFISAFKVWNKKFSHLETHDTDTYNEQKQT